MRHLLLLSLLVVAFPAAAETIVCRVVGISDGDTLTCLTAAKTQLKVRLAEIDTPEKAQPYGTRSRQALSDLAFGKQATLHIQDTDRYGRAVARVSVDGRDVNREMVSQGAAWVYRAYNRDKSLLAAESEAKAAGWGLWVLPEAERMPPWEWRKAGKKPLQTTAILPAVADTGGYQCAEKRYCSQMTSCAEATFYLQQCAVRSLDGDGDGQPCEAVCR